MTNQSQVRRSCQRVRISRPHPRPRRRRGRRVRLANNPNPPAKVIIDPKEARLTRIKKSIDSLATQLDRHFGSQSATLATALSSQLQLALLAPYGPVFFVLVHPSLSKKVSLGSRTTFLLGLPLATSLLRIFVNSSTRS